MPASIGSCALPPARKGDVKAIEANRALRPGARRKARESAKSAKTLNMTRESLENSLRAARSAERAKALEYAVRHYTTALAIVLLDKWEFGREELKTALLQIGDMYDSIARGFVDDRDIRAGILAETGLDLDRKITENS